MHCVLVLYATFGIIGQTLPSDAENLSGVNTTTEYSLPYNIVLVKIFTFLFKCEIHINLIKFFLMRNSLSFYFS